MILKTYTAGSMAEVLALVKQDLGPTASILHTRTYKRGGILGIGRRQIVEITATDDAQLGTQRRRLPTSRPTSPAARPMPPRQPKPDPERISTSQRAAGDLIRRTYAAARSEVAPVEAIRSRGTAITADSMPHPTLPQVAGQLTEEMTAVKRMVGRLIQQQQMCKTSPDIPEALFDQYLLLLERELSQELAEQIIRQVQGTLSADALADPSKVRHAILEQIARLIPVDDSSGLCPETPDERPRTIALVGPTGVGKTTTIAKLAANYKLSRKKNVGLITLDTYRIAAVEQLRTYANIIGVPLHVVVTPEELSDATRRCADCDVVLIDTAGRSQRDDPRLEQLAAYIKAANPHEVHLVLSSTYTQSVLIDTVERFSRIRTDRIILTKLDEAVSFGVLLNVVTKVDKQLSYVTTGQEVPHDIEPGKSQRLASLLLGTDSLHEEQKGAGRCP